MKLIAGIVFRLFSWSRSFMQLAFLEMRRWILDVKSNINFQVWKRQTFLLIVFPKQSDALRPFLFVYYSCLPALLLVLHLSLSPIDLLLLCLFCSVLFPAFPTHCFWRTIPLKVLHRRPFFHLLKFARIREKTFSYIHTVLMYCALTLE